MSRNAVFAVRTVSHQVAPREGRVSRNTKTEKYRKTGEVAPREGRVSRNELIVIDVEMHSGRAPRGACE